MSAEVLREAAALMRERAEEPVAQPDRWAQGVAPALALLLDNEASAMDSEWRDEFDLPPYNPARADLLTDVARAYLGRDS